MEAFIASYGLPFDGFRDLIQGTNSLIAGSAPLALYLKQEGVDPGFEPTDLDIWVEETPDTWFSNGRINSLANSTKFTIFLVKHGYNLTMKFENGFNENYDDGLTSIKHIFSFVNRNQKEIQVIMVRESNLLEYIQMHFDLTACISWWNTIENRFCNSFPHLTLAKDIHILPSFTKGERTSVRVDKYKARGFTVHEPACPALAVCDPHERIESIYYINAFDVFAYDDVCAAEFLRQSTYHVLLRVGEQFHAYHRTTLCQYLKEHTCEDNTYGLLCELPHKQLVSHNILNLLPYSDYSIIELKPMIDNLYYLEYYTTAGWVNKTPAEAHRLLPLAEASAQSSAPSSSHVFARPRTQQRHDPSELAGLTEALYRDGISRTIWRPAN